MGAWLVLLGCLGLACPALLIEIHRPQVTNPEGSRDIATSVETFRRHAPGTPGPSAKSELGNPKSEIPPASWTAEDFVPYLNDRPQLREPPGPTWVHLLAFRLDHCTGQTDLKHLITLARLTSALMALVAVAAAYWAGYSFGGLPTALLAALLCAADPLLIEYGRVASGPIHHTAWSMLSVAAALWAIRPLKPAPSIWRQALGWTLSGLALAAAFLCGGPPATWTTAFPVLLLLLLCPGRVSHLMGWLAALLLGVLLIAPWVLYANERDPQAWRFWLSALRPVDSVHPHFPIVQAWTRFVIVLAGIMPWTLWLIGAVVQPFSTSSAGSRTKLFLSWTWFAAVGLVLLLAPSAGGGTGRLLPLVPVALLLIAQLFTQYRDLAGEGRPPRFWRFLRWPQLVLLGGLSVAAPVVLATQAQLGPWGPVYLPDTAALPAWAAVGLGVVLLVLVAWSLHWVVRDHPDRALTTWALWVVVLVFVAMIPIGRGPAGRSRYSADAARLAAKPADQPIYWLVAGPAPAPRSAASAAAPWAATGGPPFGLLLYAQRTLPAIGPRQIADVRRQHAVCFLLTPADRPPPAPDCRYEGRLALDPETGERDLWFCPGLPAAARTQPATTRPAPPENAADAALPGVPATQPAAAPATQPAPPTTAPHATSILHLLGLDHAPPRG